MSDEFAFPRIQENMPIQGGPGLTKRELFAAMAMQGILSDSTPGVMRNQTSVAGAAVFYADALLAALAKANGEGSR